LYVKALYYGFNIQRYELGERYMFVKDVMVQNQVGLHARPATFFIQKANEFKSSIWIEKEERRVNAKSLLGILSLGIVGGTQIRIIADGVDEEAAVSGLVELVESGFAEETR
jgi:phosphocarrier protein